MMVSVRYFSWFHHEIIYCGYSSEAPCHEIRNKFLQFSIKMYVVGYSLKAPQRGTSNEYSQHMILWRNKLKYRTRHIYRAVHLGFSKLLESLLLKYPSKKDAL